MVLVIALNPLMAEMQVTFIIVAIAIATAILRSRFFILVLTFPAVYVILVSFIFLWAIRWSFIYHIIKCHDFYFWFQDRRNEGPAFIHLFASNKPQCSILFGFTRSSRRFRDEWRR